jgi:phage gp29-like protein
MTSYYSDTHPRMEALQVKLLRDTPPWRKMEMLAELNKAARELALAGLRQRYPEADETTLVRYLGNILLGSDIAGRVYAEMEDGA